MRDDAVKEASRIAVIGLGKIGLGFAACLARNGFDVLGVDTDTGLVDRINAGAAVSDEPGVAGVLSGASDGCLRATADVAEVVSHADTAFLLLPTPSRPDGRLDAGPLVDAVTALCRAILARAARDRFTMVVGSTVSPGTMTGAVIPAVERVLGQAAADAVDVCYNPELVALGSVVAGFECPDLIIIGASHEAAGVHVEQIHRRLVRNTPVVHHLSLLDAEIAKLALNNYLTIKISFANFLSQVCAGIRGSDVDAVTRVLGSDGRIGAKCLRAGPAFGGPCFPRDLAALAAWARDHGQQAPLVDAVAAVNRAQHDLLVQAVRAEAVRAGRPDVAILGLSFKAGTPYTVASPSLMLAEALQAEGHRIIAYDTRALADTRGASARWPCESASDAAACIDAAPVIVLMHPEPPYIDAIAAYRGRDRKVVVDCWGAIASSHVAPSVRVIRLGQASRPA